MLVLTRRMSRSFARSWRNRGPRPKLSSLIDNKGPRTLFFSTFLLTGRDFYAAFFTSTSSLISRSGLLFAS